MQYFLGVFWPFRFFLSQGSDAPSRLREWLDPMNQNPTTQNGYPQSAPQILSISGNIQTHWGVPMPGVQVNLSGSTTATVYTDASGNYTFGNLAAGGNYVVAPVRDTNHLNGVSTFDLVLITKHILGLDPLDSPWKIIAADANKSNSVTTFDIVEIRKLILGIYLSYPANTAWRFLPANANFPNPANPFGATLPVGSLSVNNLQTSQTGVDFKGTKIGDANNSADPGQ